MPHTLETRAGPMAAGQSETAADDTGTVCDWLGACYATTCHTAQRLGERATLSEFTRSDGGRGEPSPASTGRHGPRIPSSDSND